MHQENGPTNSSRNHEDTSNNNINSEVANAVANVLHDHNALDRTFAPPHYAYDDGERAVFHPNKTFAPEHYLDYGGAQNNRNVVFDESANKTFAPMNNMAIDEDTPCDPNETFCPPNNLFDDTDGMIRRRRPVDVRVWNDPTTGQSISTENNGNIQKNILITTTHYDTPKSSKRKWPVEDRSSSEPRGPVSALVDMIANPNFPESAKYGVLISVDELLLRNAASPLPLIQEIICKELAYLMRKNRDSNQDMVKRILSIVRQISAYSPEGKRLVHDSCGDLLQKLSDQCTIVYQANELLAQLNQW